MLKYLSIFALLLITNMLSAQLALPDHKVKTLDNKTISLQSVIDEGKPLVISFWATWCKPCVNELSEIADVYEEWQSEVSFNFMAVSIDDARSVAKVKSLVRGKDWPFTIVLDANQELKRKLNVSIAPHIFVFDKYGKIVYQHQGYTPGSEYEVLEHLKQMGSENK